MKKLLINCFTTIGGNHYTVIPVDGMPNELAELGGGKIIEVSEEEEKEIMKKQAEAITFQCQLSFWHRDGRKVGAELWAPL